MASQKTLWHLLLGAAFVALCAGGALADGHAEKAEPKQEQKQEASEKAAPSKAAQDDAEEAEEKEELPAVITTEYLRKRFGGGGDDDDTESPPAAAAPAPKPAPAAKPTPTTTTKPSGEAAPQGEQPPQMTPAERTKRIAEIRAELERLDKRKLALRNPFLAGTVPPTDAEKAEEKGMDNVARLDNTDRRIAELEKELASLQSSPN